MNAKNTATRTVFRTFRTQITLFEVKYSLFLLSTFSLVLLMTACKPSLGHLGAKNANGNYQAVVEIPAGTNLKLEYQKKDKQIAADQENGKDRMIDFLPYPGNYGYVPGTEMSKSEGGDGDALDVLILSESMESGSVVEIIPIAALKMFDGGEEDTKIIAIPLDPKLRIMDMQDYSSFLTEYHLAKQIIQNWFLAYKGLGEMELKGWEDGRWAVKELESKSK